MKKIAYLIILTLTVISCDQKTTPGNMTFDGQYQRNENDIRYFKDNQTQKCFAERGVQRSYSFTCIPCDSLVLEAIKNQK